MSCSKFILQDNQTEFQNELMYIFDTSGIKQIYSNPFFSRGNSRIKTYINLEKNYSKIRA